MRVLRSLEEQAAYLERRKRELGLPLGPMVELRNSGRRRTASKKALLARLAELKGAASAAPEKSKA